MIRMPLFDELNQWLDTPLIWLVKHLRLDNLWNFIKPLFYTVVFHLKHADFNFILFRIVAPIAFIILIWTYVVFGHMLLTG
ncbi:hypothetical protein JCM16816_01520 [Thermoanaerobacter brockii subsp. lactiethylicus]|jgi:hypothetical protein